LREDASDRSRENNDVAAVNGALQVGFRSIDRSAVQRRIQHGLFVAADNGSGEAVSF